MLVRYPYLAPHMDGPYYLTAVVSRGRIGLAARHTLRFRRVRKEGEKLIVIGPVPPAPSRRRVHDPAHATRCRGRRPAGGPSRYERSTSGLDDRPLRLPKRLARRSPRGRARPTARAPPGRRRLCTGVTDDLGVPQGRRLHLDGTAIPPTGHRPPPRRALQSLRAGLGAAHAPRDPSNDGTGRRGLGTDRRPPRHLRGSRPALGGVGA